jgi:hypothetical protein
MTWRRVAWIYLALVVLTSYVLVFERASLDVVPGSAPPPIEESLLQVAPEAIVALTFRHGTREVHAVEEGGRWQVLRPVETTVASDLLAAFVGTLTAGQASEVMQTGAEGDLASYGLATPSAEIEIATRDSATPVVRVLLGNTNPTRTALYAKRDDRDVVYLVGLNVRYYTDLVFAGAGG